jgi:hypothetical protein
MADGAATVLSFTEAKPPRVRRMPTNGAVIPGPFPTWEELPAEVRQQYYSGRSRRFRSGMKAQQLRGVQ